ITKLPPELMANGGDLQSGCRLGGVLDGLNRSGGGQKQHNHDQDWNNGPGQLDLRTAVHLGRFTPRVHRSPAEFHDGIDQQGADDDKYDSCNDKDQNRHIENGFGRGGLGVEDICEPGGWICQCGGRRRGHEQEEEREHKKRAQLTRVLFALHWHESLCLDSLIKRITKRLHVFRMHGAVFRESYHPKSGLDHLGPRDKRGSRRASLRVRLLPGLATRVMVSSRHSLPRKAWLVTKFRHSKSEAMRT